MASICSGLPLWRVVPQHPSRRTAQLRGGPPPHACPQPACPRGPTFPANLRCQLAPSRGPGTLSSVTPKERCVAVADGHGGVNSEGRVGRISDPANSSAPGARTAVSLVLRTPALLSVETLLGQWASRSLNPGPFCLTSRAQPRVIPTSLGVPTPILPTRYPTAPPCPLSRWCSSGVQGTHKDTGLPVQGKAS